MKPKAYFLVFDGLADWELAHALCEINKSGKFEVVSVGFSDKADTRTWFEMFKHGVYPASEAA